MLSICTPTYNRSYTLDRLYESLLSQTDKNFEWIVIDDGSTDDTQEKLKEFQNEKKIKIKYIYQKNQGKHLSLNKAYEMCRYDYVLCLDSDDWLVDQAVAIINKDYLDVVSRDESLVGAVYLDKYSNGDIVGSNLPHNQSVNWIHLRHKNKMVGDKCYVFKKQDLLTFPFVSLNNNKHMPPTYQFYLMCQRKNLYTVNEALKVVEYLEDGISKNVKINYFESAENYSYYRKIIHPMLPNAKDRLKNLTLYNISYRHSTKIKKTQLESTKDRIIASLLLPFSCTLAFYYQRKYKSSKNKQV